MNRQKCTWFLSLLIQVCFLGLSAQTTAQTTLSLPRSTPEQEGVSSAGILRFIDAAEKSRSQFHSIMVLRHGKVIAEGWWDPYKTGIKQTLYSVSKSITSTAVGFAVSEGRLHVDDKVISFFPHDLPDTVGPYLAALTVKDLLCMLEGQDPDPTFVVAMGDTNWIRGFFKVPIVHKPGTEFLYNTIGVYMLSAIVQKVTGQKEIDYLQPRLFDPLGIKGADWEASPQGISVGGWGIRLKTEDMAKIGQLYLQDGKWEGKQILPKSWVAAATTSYNDQGPVWSKNAPRDSSDYKQGYGFLFWRCRHHAYRADGAVGQFIIVMPDQDAVVAITCETADMQGELNLVWNELLPAMHPGGGSLPADPNAVKILRARLASLTMPFPQGQPSSSMSAAIEGKSYRLAPNGLGIETLRFGFGDGLCNVVIHANQSDYKLAFGSGKWARGESSFTSPNLAPLPVMQNQFAPFAVGGAYAWTDDHTLELHLMYPQGPHSYTLTCQFEGDKIHLAYRQSGDFGRNLRKIDGQVTMNDVRADPSLASENGNPEDRASLQRTTQAIRDAFARGDVAAIVALHHPDIIKYFGGSNVINGREALEKNLIPWLDANRVEFTENTVESTLFNGGTAIETCIFAIRNVPKNGEKPTVARGRSMVTYVRSGDSPTGWLSIREITQAAPEQQMTN